MRTLISRMTRVAALTLLTSLAAAANPATALPIAEQAPAAKDVTRISVTIPAGTSRLERRGTATYMIKTSARRSSAVPAAGRPVEPAQLLWIGLLLMSTCWFALFFGRELTIRFPARRG